MCVSTYILGYVPLYTARHGHGTRYLNFHLMSVHTAGIPTKLPEGSRELERLRVVGVFYPRVRISSHCCHYRLFRVLYIRYFSFSKRRESDAMVVQ